MFRVSLKTFDRISLATISVVILVSGFLALGTATKRQKQVAQKNTEIAQKLKGLQIARQNLKRLEKSMNEKEKLLAAFNEKIPETPRFGEFLDQLDRMVQQKKVSLISVKPNPGVPVKTLTRIPVQMLFRGTFVNILNLIRGLETMDRAVVMEKITIGKSAPDKLCGVEVLASIFSRSKGSRR